MSDKLLGVPLELVRLYETRLERKGVAAEHRPHYRKWLRFYWDFCHKYAFEPTDRQSSELGIVDLCRVDCFNGPARTPALPGIVEPGGVDCQVRPVPDLLGYKET